MPDPKWGESVSDSNRRDQLKLVYDYVKFHIGVYLATPAALAVIADGLGVKQSLYFVAGLGAAIAVYLLAGIHAGMFMSRHVNDPWQTSYLQKFESEAFSPCRRFIHHSLSWVGLVLGLLGLSVAVFVKYTGW
jgi:hypothetical protein